jgi:hypothetical protein
MEAQTALDRTKVSNRSATCLWCRRPAPHAEVVRNRGLCEPCATDNGEIGWRVVYDRDQQIGAIPLNLRRAYGL